MSCAILCAAAVLLWTHCLQYAEAQNVCGQPPTIDKAVISGQLQDSYPVDTELTYSCELGYITKGTKRTAKCINVTSNRKETTWTLPDIICSARSCGDPGYVEHAYRNGSVFTFPNSVVFVCEEGYKINGLSTRYCKPNGQWSGGLPSCERIFCRTPENLANGMVTYSSLEYGSELQYSCDAGFLLKSEGKRYCSKGGRWSGEQPTCIEKTCDVLEKPEHGFVNLIGDGSIVVFTCEEGRVMVGSKISKCLDSGEWTFSAPLCVEPCKVPDLPNGQMGTIKEGLYPRRKFVQIPAGTVINENRELYLKCQENFEPVGQPVAELKIACEDGQWSVKPECVPKPCEVPYLYHGMMGFITEKIDGSQTFEKIPAKSTVASGTYLYLKCNNNYQPAGQPKTELEVSCDRGRWSVNPQCLPKACIVPRLYNGEMGAMVKESYFTRPAFVKVEPGRNVEDGSELILKCNKHYEPAGYPQKELKVSCYKGEWSVNPQCLPIPCKNNPPSIQNGQAVTTRWSHGVNVTYLCNSEHFTLIGGTVKCHFGSWTQIGNMPFCSDNRCNLNRLPVKEGIDLLSTDLVLSGQYANISCLKGYSLKYDKPKCYEGVWQMKSNDSPCQPSQCVVPDLQNGEIRIAYINKSRVNNKIVENRQFKKVNFGSEYDSGTELQVICTPPYIFQGKYEDEIARIVCSFGKWNLEPLCLKAEMQQSTTSHPHIPTEFTSAILRTAITEEIALTKPSEEHATKSEGGNSESSSSNNATDFKDNKEIAIEGLAKRQNPEFINNTSCFCEYRHHDEKVVAYIGDRKVEFAEKIKQGDSVYFRCKNVGYDLLHGLSSIMCSDTQICFWESTTFPSCLPPSKGDTFINVTVWKGQKKVHPSGYLTISPRADVHLKCGSLAWKYPIWETPYSHTVSNSYKQIGEMYLLYSSILIKSIKKELNGNYICHGENTFNLVEIRVEEIYCPEIFLNDATEVKYEGNRKADSVAKFFCEEVGTVIVGSKQAVCKSNGEWSHKPPVCQPINCSIDSLFAILPHEVQPLLVNGTTDHLPYNTTVDLVCDQENHHILGTASAVCDSTGGWIISDIQCVPGCKQIKSSTDLIIAPQKEVYRLGETIVFSCPFGQSLRGDVQVMMCLSYGWSESVFPNCTNIDAANEKSD